MRHLRLSWGTLGAAWTWLGLGATARADQFIVTDVTYTHAEETTSDSHYRVSPLPGTPDDWTSPVDYSTGSAHVRLEVRTKPTATPTRFQICFEATPSYACTDQSPPYTTTGTYEWSTPFASFYKGNNTEVDWTQGVNQVALILKDTSNGKPQGDPDYVPTDLRVEVAIVSPGASYVPPARDAGAADAGDAGRTDAGASADAGTYVDAGAAQMDAGRGPSSGDGTPFVRDAARPLTDATTALRDAGPPREGGVSLGESEPDDDDGCSAAASGRGNGWTFGAVVGLFALLRRRRPAARGA